MEGRQTYCWQFDLLAHKAGPETPKLLLPREYISRCRQKGHWASKDLPQKEPVNPKHDTFKYSDIALKVIQDGKNKYRIGRVEAMEST